MSDCVKRQDAIDTFLVGKNTFAGFCTIEQAIENIESVEAADVVEIKRGYWLECADDITCSSCKATYSDEILFMNRNFEEESLSYCPNCGADMRGERNG